MLSLSVLCWAGQIKFMDRILHPSCLTCGGPCGSKIDVTAKVFPKDGQPWCQVCLLLGAVSQYKEFPRVGIIVHTPQRGGSGELHSIGFVCRGRVECHWLWVCLSACVRV